MSDQAHHIGIGPDEAAGNGGRGRFFFLPGSPGRAARIAERFHDGRTFPNSRRHDVHIGELRLDGVTVDVGVAATGMGCPSVGIIVSELIAVGVRRFVRVGTTGTLHAREVPVGSVVIATAAVRDEATSDVFAPRDVPAVAHPDQVASLIDAATRLGFADHTFAGTVHTKDAFYGREFPEGPLAEASHRYMAMLEAMGVLATEMECAHLFVLAAAKGADLTPIGRCNDSPSVVKAGGVLAVVGDVDAGFAEPTVVAQAEQRAIDIALHGAAALIRREGAAKATKAR